MIATIEKKFEALAALTGNDLDVGGSGVHVYLIALDEGAVTGINVVCLGESQLSCARLATCDSPAPIMIVSLRGSDRVIDNLVLSG